MDIQVIKIGSASLFTNGRVDCDAIGKTISGIEDYSEKTNTGNVLIVSGAVALGKTELNETRTNSELTTTELQCYASVGQNILMNLYSGLFNQKTAQILFTDHELHRNFSNLKNVLLHNAEKGLVSLLNYNDPIDTEEVRLDNDFPSAMLAVKLGAKRLVMYGVYQGFLSSSGELIPDINKITDNLYGFCNGTSKYGTGGCSPKLQAADHCISNNVEMMMVNRTYSLEDAILGKVPRTLFKR